MQITQMLRFMPRQANLVAITSLIFLLLKIYFFGRIPAPFANSYDLGPVFENILDSVLASYVFYFFVVHLKEQADRSIVEPYNLAVGQSYVSGFYQD